MPSKIDSKWFRRRLAELDKSQSDLARHMGMDRSAVSRIINGQRGMGFDDVAAIARFLECPIETVLYHAGVEVQAPDPSAELQRQIPVVASVDADWQLQPYPDGHQGEISAGAPQKAVGARMETGAMRGSVIVYVPPVDQIDPAAVGRLAVMRLDDDRRFYGRLTQGTDIGRYSICTATQVLQDAPVIAASPVLMIRP